MRDDLPTHTRRRTAYARLLSTENRRFAADRQSQRVTPHPVERNLPGQRLDPFAIAAELIPSRRRNALGNQPYAHCADRMFRAAAARSRDSRRRNRNIRAGFLDRSCRHLAHAFLTDRAVTLESFLAHAEDAGL